MKTTKNCLGLLRLPQWKEQQFIWKCSFLKQICLLVCLPLSNQPVLSLVCVLFLKRRDTKGILRKVSWDQFVPPYFCIMSYGALCGLFSFFIGAKGGSNVKDTFFLLFLIPSSSSGHMLKRKYVSEACGVYSPAHLHLLDSLGSHFLLELPLKSQRHNT